MLLPPLVAASSTSCRLDACLALTPLLVRLPATLLLDGATVSESALHTHCTHAQQSVTYAVSVMLRCCCCVAFAASRASARRNCEMCSCRATFVVVNWSSHMSVLSSYIYVHAVD